MRLFSLKRAWQAQLLKGKKKEEEEKEKKKINKFYISLACISSGAPFQTPRHAERVSGTRAKEI